MGINKTKITIIAVLGLALIYWPVSICLAQEKAMNKDEVIKLVNESRREEGLDPVLESPVLDRIAQNKAQDMAEKRYFSHNSPTGTSPWFWFEKGNYNYEYAGENLAMNYEDASEQHQAWMRSQTHRKNILNESFQDVGVAIVPVKVADGQGLLTVQEFGTLKGAVIAKRNNEPIDQKIYKNLSYPIGSEIPGYKKSVTSDQARNLGASKVNEEANGIFYNNLYLIILTAFFAIALAGPLMIILSQIKKNRWEDADEITKTKIVTSWGEYLGFFKGISGGNIG